MGKFGRKNYSTHSGRYIDMLERKQETFFFIKIKKKKVTMWLKLDNPGGVLEGKKRKQ